MKGDYLIAWFFVLSEPDVFEEHYEIVYGEDAMTLRVSELTNAGACEVVVGVITEGTRTIALRAELAFHAKGRVGI